MIQRRAARTAANLGKRHLGLGDNLTSLLAFDKGRSSSQLNTLCKRSAAYQLGGAMQWVWRHVESERNVTDRGSRLFGPDLPRLYKSVKQKPAVAAIRPPPGLAHPSFSACGPEQRGAVLELFAGSAGLSRALKNHRLIVLNPVDIKYGSEYDLTNVRVQEVILAVIRAGGLGYVHLGLPCRAWAASRQGLASAAPGGAERDRVGLCLAMFCVQVVRACDSLNIGWSIENPANSGLWRFPPIARLVDDPQNHVAIFQSCFSVTPIDETL